MPNVPMPEQNAARYKRGMFLTSFRMVEICELEMEGSSPSALNDVKVLGRMMTMKRLANTLRAIIEQSYTQPTRTK
jgi:hypothetical protein